MAGFKDTFNKSIASIGAKASNNVEKSRLKSIVDNGNKEAEAMFTELGRKVYFAWNTDGFELSEVEPQLTAIKEKFEEIKNAFSELKAIEEKEALAKQPAPQPVAPMYAQPVVPVQAPVVPVAAPVVPVQAPVAPVEPIGCTCPNCGAHFDTVVNFCRMCGTKIAK